MFAVMLIFSQALRDPITIKGMSGSMLVILADLIIQYIGTIVGVASGLLGLYLLILSIVQKRREMNKWQKDNRRKL